MKKELPYFVKVPGLPGEKRRKRKKRRKEKREINLAALWCRWPFHTLAENLCPHCGTEMKKKVLILGGSRSPEISQISCPKCGAGGIIEYSRPFYSFYPRLW